MRSEGQKNVFSLSLSLSLCFKIKTYNNNTNQSSCFTKQDWGHDLVVRKDGPQADSFVSVLCASHDCQQRLLDQLQHLALRLDAPHQRPPRQARVREEVAPRPPPGA